MLEIADLRQDQGMGARVQRACWIGTRSGAATRT